MLQEPEQLGRAGGVGTARSGLALRPYHFPAAHRALLRHLELFFLARAPGRDRRDHLRDDVARATYDDVVAFADVLAAHVVLVVQGGVRDGDTTDIHRLQVGDGREHARAPDVHVNVAEARRALVGRELPGDGPAGLVGHRAQYLMVAERIDLHHDAVGLVGEPLALLRPLAIVGEHVVCIVHQLRRRIRLESEVLKVLHTLPMRRRHPCLGRPQGPDENVEGTLGGDPGVELAQRAGSGVAGVGEEGQPLLCALRIELLESSQWYERLAARFEAGRCDLPQSKRDAADCAQVLGNVLATEAVAARRADGEAVVLVAEGDGNAVYLQLAHHVEAVNFEEVLGALVPGEELLLVEGVGQAEHRCAVLYDAERLDGRSPDALGRRVGRDQLGMGRLQLDEAAHEPVVLGVADDRLGEHVVAVVVVVYFRPELLDLVLNCGQVVHRRPSVVVGPATGAFWSRLRKRL